jgi:hypothetical protein
VVEWSCDLENENHALLKKKIDIYFCSNNKHQNMIYIIFMTNVWIISTNCVKETSMAIEIV